MVLRVGSYASLEYWMDRLIANQHHSELLRLDPTSPQSLVFWDPEGHEVELMVSDSTDAPLVADADDIPAEHRILGLEGARSYTTIEEQAPFAAHLGFRVDGNRLVLDGERSGRWYFSAPTGRPSNDGRVGVWHHIAYDAGDGEETQRARDEANEGLRPWTKIFDHYFFDSCYTMSPGGRMEICTTGPGFQLDEKLEDLGDRLCLSPRVEPLRAKLEVRADADRQPAPALQEEGRPSRPPTASRRRSLRPSPDVTLSFDNGPDPAATPRVLDVLAERGLKATFFVVGEQLRAHRALAERAVAEGHWIGNHTLTHPRPLGEVAEDAARCEIEATQDAIGALAHPDRLFRPSGEGGELQRGLLSLGGRRRAGRRRLHVRALERRPGRLEGPGRVGEPRAGRVRVARAGRCSCCTTSRAAPPSGSRSSSTARRCASGRTSRARACRSAAA